MGSAETLWVSRSSQRRIESEVGGLLREGSMLVEWQETVPGTCKPVPRTTAGQATPAEPKSFCCRD
jgi:hypothetical protein